MGHRKGNCLVCGKALGRGRIDRETCGDRCRKSKQRSSTSNPAMQIKQGSCLWCHKVIQWQGSRVKKYCSCKCSQAMWRWRHDVNASPRQASF